MPQAWIERGQSSAPMDIRIPGAYIQESLGQIVPIAGVSTSITAFIGWAARGPITSALRIQSFQDFIRHYGGLDRRSLLGYSVNHFFANGGRDAYVVRLGAADAVAASLVIDAKIVVSAASPGAWANDYRIESSQSRLDATRFTLAVIHQPSGQQATPVERFENLSMQKQDARFVERIINSKSASIRVAVTAPFATAPADTKAVRFSTRGSDGTVLNPNEPSFERKLDPITKDSGIHLLDQIDLFNLLCVPGETSTSIISSLQRYCQTRRAFLIVDSPRGATPAAMQSFIDARSAGHEAANSALYFPWLSAEDPLDQNRIRSFPPCGFVAGIYARIDSQRGVWKAPAGFEANVSGVVGTDVALSDAQIGTLNPRGINCIRTLPSRGTLLWGSRTLHGADVLASDWKYVPIRRLALFIEESLLRGTSWIAFEANDELLWSRVRLTVGAFMDNLFRQGALQGNRPQEAYFVKCDSDTTSTDDINLGIVNILVGFAPLRPAEFVVMRIQRRVSPPPNLGDHP